MFFTIKASCDFWKACDYVLKHQYKGKSELGNMNYASRYTPDSKSISLA